MINTKDQESFKRTSLTDPIYISEAVVDVPAFSGLCLGLTLCPGVTGISPGGDWDRDLETDMDAVRAWAPTHAICALRQQVVAVADILECDGIRVTRISPGTWPAPEDPGHRADAAARLSDLAAEIGRAGRPGSW